MTSAENSTLQHPVHVIEATRAVERGEEDLRFAMAGEIRAAMSRIIDDEDEPTFLVSRITDFSEGHDPERDEVLLASLSLQAITDPADIYEEQPAHCYFTIDGALSGPERFDPISVSYCDFQTQEEIMEQMAALDLLDVAKLRVGLRDGVARVVTESRYDDLIQRAQHGVLDLARLTR
jgi:hypothetical protein